MYLPVGGVPGEAAGRQAAGVRHHDTETRARLVDEEQVPETPTGGSRGAAIRQRSPG